MSHEIKMPLVTDHLLSVVLRTEVTMQTLLLGKLESKRLRVKTRKNPKKILMKADIFVISIILKCPSNLAVCNMNR